MKEPLLLGRFTAAAIAGLAFAAAGSRLAVATSDLVLEKGHAEAWAVALVVVGVLVLVLGQVRSPRRGARIGARVAATAVALFGLGVFLAPAVSMIR